MTALDALDLRTVTTTRHQAAGMLARAFLASLALTAGLFGAVPVAINGGALAFTLYSGGSAVLMGILLKGDARAHSIFQFLGCFLLCGAEILFLWDISPRTNLLICGAAVADSVVLSMFAQLLYGVFAFFTMFLTIALRRHEDD